ncbi:hypothetical protein [Cellulomonas sp. SG140]|uniref:hypothetical protein n=1 Tax=Cellulomonas sp. SG140 TaxID=2976536 RepID=UPI0021E807BC|nr:hypothetical protein [Cellulomonas sp. SG140]
MLTGTVMMIGLATGASAAASCVDAGGGGQDESQGVPAHPFPQRGGSHVAPATATGAYVYRKRDASRPASWDNSTQQYLVATWSGAEYRPLSLDQVRTALAAEGIELCGSGWGVQEDQAYGTQSLFTGTPAPSYPKATIGWPPIFAAQHWTLDKLVQVPACAAATAVPTPTPTPTATPKVPAAPVVVPTETPSPVQTTPSTGPSRAATTSPTASPAATVAPAATPSATAAPVATPKPSVSPSQDVVDVVLSAPDSTQSASPQVVSAVLAAEDRKGSLAQTGAAPIGVAVAAVLLVAAGVLLLVLRRRGAMR